MSPSEMLVAGRYREAAAIYETRIKKRPNDAGTIACYGDAMLCLRRFSRAADCYRHATAIESETLGGSQPYVEHVGVALWLHGRHQESIEILRSAVDGIADGSIEFADIAGGVTQGLLLWYAGVTAGDNTARDHALSYLRKLAKQPRIKYWPGPAALFVLGRKSPTTILRALCGTTDVERAMIDARSDLGKRRELVQALFYFAAKQRAEGGEDECLAGMRACASLANPVVELEWYLARAEAEGEIGPR